MAAKAIGETISLYWATNVTPEELALKPFTEACCRRAAVDHGYREVLIRKGPHNTTGWGKRAKHHPWHITADLTNRGGEARACHIYTTDGTPSWDLAYRPDGTPDVRFADERSFQPDMRFQQIRTRDWRSGKTIDTQQERPSINWSRPAPSGQSQGCKWREQRQTGYAPDALKSSNRYHGTRGVRAF